MFIYLFIYLMSLFISHDKSIDLPSFMLLASSGEVKNAVSYQWQHTSVVNPAHTSSDLLTFETSRPFLLDIPV